MCITTAQVCTNQISPATVGRGARVGHAERDSSLVAHSLLDSNFTSASKTSFATTWLIYLRLVPIIVLFFSSLKLRSQLI